MDDDFVIFDGDEIDFDDPEDINELEEEEEDEEEYLDEEDEAIAENKKSEVFFVSKIPREVPKYQRLNNYNMSKFEKAVVIGTRAKDLSNGANPRIDLEEAKRIEDVIRIATLELERYLLGDYKIKRTYTDGSYEIWDVSELKI